MRVDSVPDLGDGRQETSAVTPHAFASRLPILSCHLNGNFQFRTFLLKSATSALGRRTPVCYRSLIWNQSIGLVSGLNLPFAATTSMSLGGNA